MRERENEREIKYIGPNVTQDADMWSDALRIVKEYLPHKVTYYM